MQLFTRKWCGKQLQWWIVQDLCDTGKAPDIIFEDDPSFSPLTTAEQCDTQQLVQLLSNWTGDTAALIGLLLSLYVQHNKARIAAAVTDERILFELTMLDELGCQEVLLTGGDGNGPQQARFALPVPVDLQPAQQLLSCLNKLEQQQQPQLTHQPHQHQHQQHKPQQDQEQQQFVLTVAFSVSPGGTSSHIPVLQLRSPPWFTTQLPTMQLPAWDPHTSLLEYIPHLAERVSKHLADHCPAAANRFLLFEGLSGLLGPPLELNMALLQSGGSSSSSSSALGGSPAAASSRVRGAAAAGSAAGVWHVLFDQQPLLLFVELPRSYPTDCPVLCLQNLRRTGSDSCVTLQNLPWSPRWPVDEQVARLFNFLKLQAAKVSVVDTAAVAAAAAGGAAGAGAAPLGGSMSPGAAGVMGQAGVGGLPPGFY